MARGMPARPRPPARERRGFPRPSRRGRARRRRRRRRSPPSGGPSASRWRRSRRRRRTGSGLSRDRTEDPADRPDAERFAHVAEQLRLGHGGPWNTRMSGVPSSSLRSGSSMATTSGRTCRWWTATDHPLSSTSTPGMWESLARRGSRVLRPSPGGLRTPPRDGSDALREDATRARWRLRG